MFRLGEKSVGRVHQKTLALAFAAAMAVSPKVLRVFKSCVWFAVMIIFDKFRALDSQRQRPLPCRNTLAGRFAPLAWASRRKELALEKLVSCGGDGDAGRPARGGDSGWVRRRI